ncbi:MAG: HAMP domain-containing histidine kinase, partial [Elusimicrobia bacterium]|nr:HAMP domain-containing histidine kinase [Elusimicrobiota bacterium]
FYFYNRAIIFYLGVKSEAFEWLLKGLKIAAAIFVASLIVHLFSNHSLMYLPIPRHRITPILVLKGGALATPTLFADIVAWMVALIFLCAYGFILSRLYRRRPHDYILAFGVAFSLFAGLSELLIAFGWLNMVSIVAFSKIFELLRMGRYYRSLAENKIEQLESQLGLLSQKAATSFVTGSVVHDIRNPLAIIQLNMNICLEASACGEMSAQECTAAFADVKTQSDRIADILKSYLDLRRGAANVQMADIELPAVLQGALELSRHRLIANGVPTPTLSFPDEAGRIKVHGNKTQLELAVANLLNNSADAVGGSGDKWIKITVESQGGAACITLVDSGNGLPAEVAEDLFGGRSTKGESGNGLGLRIAKEILQAHDATIAYLPQAPNTSFRIKIPLAG